MRIWPTISSILSSKSIVSVVLFVVLSSIASSPLLLRGGTVGLRHDWIIPPYSEQLVQLANSRGSLWDADNLGRFIAYPADYMLIFLLGMWGYLGINGEVLSKAFVVLVPAAAGWAFQRLCRRMGCRFWPSFAGGALYAFGPVMVNRLAAGQASYLFAYAVAPLAVSEFFRVFQESSRPRFVGRLCLAALLFALAVAQIQFILLLGFVLLVVALLSDSTKLRVKFRNTFLVVAIALLTQLPLVIATLFNPTGIGSLVAGASQSAQIRGSSVSVLDGLSLVGYQPEYFEASLPPGAAGYFTAGAIFLVGLSFLLFSIAYKSEFRRRAVGFAAIYLTGLLLVTGTNPPGSILYSWLINSPAASVFREMYHYTFLTAFGLSGLLAIGWHSFTSRGLQLPSWLKRNWKLGFFRFLGRLSKKVPANWVLPGCAWILLALVVLPMLSGSFTSQLQTYKSSREQYDELVRTTQGDFRTLILPTIDPISYDGSPFSGQDPLLVFPPNPGLSGPPSSPYAGYLAMLLQYPVTSHLCELLGLAGFDSVVFRPDVSSNLPQFLYPGSFPNVDEAWTTERTSQVLENQKCLESRPSASDWRFYKVAGAFPIVTANSGWTYLGGDLSLLTRVAYDLDLYTHTYPYVSLGPGIFQKDQILESPLLSSVDWRHWLEFGAVNNAVPVSFTTGQFEEADARRGWVNWWWWYDWRITAAGRPVAMTLTSAERTVEVNLEAEGEYEMWARFFDSPYGSSISLKVDGMPVAVVPTTTSIPAFRWHRSPVGNLERGLHRITLDSGAGLAAVSELYLVMKKDAMEAAVQANLALGNRSVNILDEAEAFIQPSANDGTMTGTTDAEGKWGRAREFDGDLDTIGATNLSLSLPITLAAWVKRDATQRSTQGNVISKFSNYEMRVTDGGYIVVRYSDFIAWRELTSSQAIPNGEWTHIAAVFKANGSNTDAEILMNGAVDNSTTLVGQPGLNSFLLHFGRSPVYASENYRGAIDETYIFNRALSAGEVGALAYQSIAGAQEEGEVLHYDMSTFEAGKMKDLSGGSIETDGMSTGGSALFLKPYAKVFANTTVPDSVRAEFIVLARSVNGSASIQLPENELPLDSTWGWYSLGTTLRSSFAFQVKGRVALDLVQVRTGEMPQWGAVDVVYNRPSPSAVDVAIDEPALVVFGETYDPGWIVATPSGDVMEPWSPGVCNGFANCWYLQPGQYRIEYGPDAFYLIGLRVSLGVVVVLLAVASFSIFLPKRQKGNLRACGRR